MLRNLESLGPEWSVHVQTNGIELIWTEIPAINGRCQSLVDTDAPVTHFSHSIVIEIDRVKINVQLGKPDSYDAFHWRLNCPDVLWSAVDGFLKVTGNHFIDYRED